MRMPGGLVPVFVCGSCMGAVKPSVRPCIEGRGENDGGYGECLCGDAEDEDDSEGVHGDVALFLGWCFSAFWICCCIRAGVAPDQKSVV